MKEEIDQYESLEDIPEEINERAKRRTYYHYHTQPREAYCMGWGDIYCSHFNVRILPKGKAYLADQLKRAGSSIPLNIAEGAGEFSLNEKIRFYRRAKRSATECASILDVC